MRRGGQRDIDLPGLPARRGGPSGSTRQPMRAPRAMACGLWVLGASFMRAARCMVWLSAAAALAVGVPVLMAAGAVALEEGKDEKQQLEACERELCGILVKREPSGSDLKCALQKTWAGRLIKQGVEQKK